MINALLSNKRFMDAMKKRYIHVNDNVLHNHVKNMLLRFKFLRYDSEANMFHLICVTHNIDYVSGKLYCIFEFDDGDVYDNVVSTLIKANCSNHNCTLEYDKYGWQHFTVPWSLTYRCSNMDRCKKMIFRDEMIICKDKQRDTDFIERVNYILNMV
jgi:hypothetical protein